MNRLGQGMKLTGQNLFARALSLRRLISSDDTYDENTPASQTAAQLTPVTAVADASAHTVTLTYNPDDGWADAAGGNLLIFVGRSTSPTRVFYKGPYRYNTSVVATGSPLTGTVMISGVSDFLEGDNVHIAVRALTRDNRVSIKQQITTVAVA
jgi:hypothetical protein